MYKDILTIEVLIKTKFNMEYITGIITLQAIFSIHWTAYCNWYKGTIRDAVIENVQKILKCRTFLLGYSRKSGIRSVHL